MRLINGVKLNGRRCPGAACILAFLPGIILPGARAATLHGPQLGFVFDPQAKGIRPILGIPAAAVEGALLPLGVELSDAAISGKQDYALAVQDGSDELLEITHLGETHSIRLLSPGPEKIDLLQLSPSGASAVIYHQQARTAQVISGLPQRPWVNDPLDLSAMPGPWSSIAVSDDAAFALGAVNLTDSAQIFLIDRHGNTRPVFSAQHISGIALVAGTHDALAADDRQGKVYLIHAVDTAAAALPVSTQPYRLTAPAAVAASPDGRRIFIVSAKSRDLLAVDTKTHITVRYPCACIPSDLDSLGSGSRFALTHTAGAPLWMFDGDSIQPRLFFVPPPPTESGASLDGGR